MKVVHLTEVELRQYRQREMLPSALLTADDHLAQCGDCRKSLERMEKGTAGEAALWRALTGSTPPGSTHLLYDELVAFAEDDWSKADREQVTEHLLGCVQCREDAEDLKSFRGDLAKVPGPRLVPKVRAKGRHFWISPVWAGAAAALLLAVFLSYWSFHNQTPPGPAVLVKLNDAGGGIQLDSAGKLTAPSPLAPAEAALIKDALLHKRVEQTAMLSSLVSPQEKLLGGAGMPKSFELVAPVGTVVLADKPTFRWQPVPDASGYVLSIYDTHFHKVAEGPRVLQPQWESDRALSRGVVYTWQVTAFVNGKAIRAPVPPAPEARFQVLSQAEAEQLEEAQQQHANSHLLLGLLYAKAGALDDSERELKALFAANPGSRVARELLASLQQLRRKPAG